MSFMVDRDSITATDRWVHGVVVAAVGVAAISCGGAADKPTEQPLDDKNATFVGGKKADSVGIEPGSQSAAGVLKFVNETTHGVLDDQVPLDRRAADNIIEHRNGPDGELGSSDDDLFDTLRELDDVPWVGPVSFQRIVDYARGEGYLPEAGAYQGPEIKSCGGEVDEGASAGCQVVQQGSGGLVLRGDVLQSDEVLENGEVYIDTSSEPARIECAGCDCASEAGTQPTIVACSSTSISPGLINPHDHLGWSTVGPAKELTGQYTHRHEWRTGARGKEEIDSPSSDRSRESIMHGELRHMLAGTTAIAGSSSGAADRGLVRNLDNADSTGGLDVEVEYSTFPLGDVSGKLKADGCDYGGFGGAGGGALREDIFLPHVAEGLGKAASNEFRCLAQPGENSQDLIENNTSIVHGVGMSAEQIRELAVNGGHLVWSPRTNISLYGDTADIATYRRFDVPIALGTDWPITGSMNMLRELGCASRFNRKNLGGDLRPSDLWKMATVNGAIALGIEDEIGRLERGYAADVALFSGEATNPFARVTKADSEDVRLVLRGGRPLYGGSAVVEAVARTWSDTAADPASGCQTLDACGESRLVCVEADTGRQGTAVTLEALQNVASSDSYPLFYCEGDSLREPTCNPLAGEEDNQELSSDADADGVRDGADSCPELFNPPMPLASGGQLDTDGDGAGDPCDICPTDADDDCEADDADGDGVANATDLCPYISNPNQSDSDSDGTGDACDASTTPYAIHDGSVAPPAKATLDRVVVTAEAAKGIFVQVPSGADSFKGAEGSGLFVYLGSGPAPARGDVVTVKGRLENYHGLVQLSTVRKLETHRSSATIPEPVEVDPCVLADNPSQSEPYLGSLVTVRNVTVSNANPDSPKDYKEFAVGECSGGNGLRVDDYLHEVTPDPKKGDEFSQLTGPLHYSFDHFKLVPRSEADVVR